MRRMVHGLNKAVDHLVLILLVAAVGLAAFLQYDSSRYFEEASSDKYAAFNPNFDEAKFAELQAENPDVLGWLALNGTEINYPLVRHKTDNRHYLNHDATGAPSASGSIFLDVYSSPDFTDFNSLIYGHYMQEHRMFGDLQLYRNADFFDTHEDGSLYYGGKAHGLKVLGFYEVSAYDELIYSPHLDGEERSSWLAHLKELAVQTRTEPQETDQLLLLSSCADDMTGGRFALLCRISGDVTVDYDSRGESPQKSKEKEPLSGAQWVGILLALILLTGAGYGWTKRRS